MAKKKKDFEPHLPPEKAHRCEHPGCAEPGVYKAPASKERLNEYRWFCLDHVREHNQKWNFFEGMDRDEIEEFMHEAVTGHRPTWSRESHLRRHYEQLQQAIYDFLNPGARRPSKPAPNNKIRKALAIMDMDYPYVAEDLKKQYRTLIKKHHPDANKGDKRSEELFKRITVAHTTLKEHLEAAAGEM